MALGIPGVDEQIFLDLFEDNTELFVSVLRIFADKAPATVDSLRKVTLPDYTNNIHALKGACANICAEEARKAALELEMLAKAGDLPGVLAGNEAFLKQMEKLLSNVQNWLKNNDK